MKVLFVCTGNTCRSSMAKSFAVMELERAGIESVEVLSAGTVTVSGRPASEKAIAAMKEMGFDIKGHRTTILEKKIAEEADLILTMTARHRREVIRICPGAAGKVFTLGEFAGSGEDVVDPFGGSLEAYRRTAGQLAGLIRLAVNRLTREVQAGAYGPETGDRRQETGDV